MSVKAAGVGHFQIPTAPGALTAVAQSASANTLGSAVSFGNAPSALYITGVTIGVATTQVPTYVQIQILVGGSVVASVLVPYGVSAGAAASVLTGYRPIFPPIPVANAAAITVKSASSVASAVSYGVSLECIAQSNVVDDGIAVGTVTTVTNQLTAAAIATAVWQDATAGDFTVASSIGKSLYTGNVAPGGSGGLMISGTNAGTTTLGALTITGVTTHTGNVVFSDGVTISAPSTGNRAGLDIAGNGTGAGLKITGGATGNGVSVIGGGTSGDGVKVTTTSGHGVNLAPVGTDKHGFFSTGGNGGTSDGIKAAAGTGGVDFRANQTGNITGNLSGSVGSVTGAVGSVTGAVGSVTGAVGSVTGNVGGNVVGSVASVTGAVGSVTGLTASNLDAAVSSRMATYTQPTGFLAATFAAGTVANTTNITAGTITTVTNLTNAPTAGDFTATMKTSIGTAVAASAVASVTGNVGGNVVGSVGSVTGLTASNLDVAVSTRLASSSYTAPDNSGISVAALAAAAAATDTAAIKAKTNSLNFTVAGKLDVNVLVINGVTVQGAGTSGSPWRPA